MTTHTLLAVATATATLLGGPVSGQGGFTIPNVSVIVDVCEPGAGGSAIPDEIETVVTLDFTQHGVDEVAVLTTAGDVYLLVAPTIHQEYELLASGITALAVLEGGGENGSDALIVSGSAGLHLLAQGTSPLTIATDAGVQDAARIVVGDWDGDDDDDLVVHDTTSPVVPGDEQLTLVRQGDPGWVLGGSETYSGPIREFDVVPDWLGANSPAIYVIEGINARVCDPNDATPMFEPYPVFPLVGSEPAVELEVFDDAGQCKVIFGWSVEVSPGQHQSQLLVATSDTGATWGFQLESPVPTRGERLRGMWSGSYLNDGYTDLVVAYEGISSPDLYLNGVRGGYASTFVLINDFVASLQTGSDEPLPGSEIAFVDIDGDGQCEFGFGTEFNEGEALVAFARDPQGASCDAPELISAILDIDSDESDLEVVVDLSNQPALWTADHAELILWRVDEDPSTGALFTERAPFRRNLMPLTAAGSGPSLKLEVRADTGDWAATGFVGVVRLVADSDPLTPEVDRSGPPVRILMTLGYTQSGNVPSAYWAAMEALLPNPAGQFSFTSPLEGAIPLIIDPVPPLPPLPPVPPEEGSDPVTGSGGTSGTGD